MHYSFCILKQLRHLAKVTPNAIAIIFEEKRLSYEDIDAFSTNLAFRLKEIGIKEGDFVGVFLPQCLELPVVLIAIWKIGAAYVPLDPIYPEGRIKAMICDAQLSVVLTKKSVKRKAIESKSYSLIDIDDCLNRSPCQKEEEWVRGKWAYLIFTSGSTGKPKGVLVSHDNVLNVLKSFRDLLDVSTNDRLLSITPISFDIFALELFLPLIQGATCFLTPRNVAIDPFKILNILHTEKITLFQATPFTYQMLIEENWPQLSLRHLLCGGEAWDRKLAESIISHAPSSSTLWNVYGPTETTIWSSCYQMTRGDIPAIVPSINQTYFYVLDENLQLAIQGELHIGGAGIAGGYYEQDQLTKEKFIANPFRNSNAPILYKTGDIVRQLGGNKLEFLGRKDQQVKIRGFRVELGEIEHMILQHPGIKQAVVFWENLNESSEKTLIACILGEKGYQKKEYYEFFSASLPPHLIPKHFINFDIFPLTSNLKTDRRKLFEDAKSKIV